MRIVVSSDWHLDASTAGFDRFDDVASAARFTADEAVRSKADMYAFLGDLCDPESRGAHRCVGEFGRLAFDLARQEVAFRAISGNHDVVDDGHGTSTLSAISGAARGQSAARRLGQSRAFDIAIHERPSYELAGDVALVWLPYVSRALSYDPEEYVSLIPVGNPRAVVVFGHLTVPEAERGSESEDFARGRDIPFPAEACRRRWGDRVTMLNGHYHRMQEAGGVRIPGSLVRLRFDEERNEPGFLVMEV